MAESDPAATHPTPVTIEREGDNWFLQVDGKPFRVHGAGMGYNDAAGIASLAIAGGNAFRTWGTEHLDVQLAAAEEYDLKVLVGLDMQKELQGFDYDDTAAVARQQQELEQSIERYRNHPAVLGWIIANEPNLMVGAEGDVVPPNPRVYAAMADVLDYLHEQDPAHPATVAFAFTPTLQEDVALALTHMPTLDFLSFQGYGALPAIPAFVQELGRELGVEKPYMITEFGPLGHWEMPATLWGREIEEPSGVKAAGLVERMRQAGLDQPRGALLGGFAFLWGQKQERTPTWYGLFTTDGQKTAAVDELERLWRGDYPAQRAPSAWQITLDERPATANVQLGTGQATTVRVQADDADGDELEVRWQLMREVDERSHGGHFEAEPESLDVTFESLTPKIEQGAEQGPDQYAANFMAPADPGEYRVFAWLSDGQGGVATANLPFRVVEP